MTSTSAPVILRPQQGARFATRLAPENPFTGESGSEGTRDLLHLCLSCNERDSLTPATQSLRCVVLLLGN